MRSGMFVVGLVLIVLGVALLFVPIPRKERHGIDAGPISVGVTTTERVRAPSVVSAVMIGGGVVLLVIGSRSKR